MKMKLISVIIPVYNVEKYIQRCIESIIDQTYKNIEIILVDDGSTDSSGKICDSYQVKDKRIKVIHKKNGGLSDARNAGITCSTGEYIAFVDSDDLVDKSYIEFLFKLISEEDSDIAVCRYKRFTDLLEVKNSDRNDNNIIYNGMQALEVLLYQPEKIPQSANAKMYRRELFDGILYPVGRLNEDIGTTYKLFYKAKKIAYNSSQYYFYFQRMDGIVRTKISNRTRDAIDFSEEILAFVKANMPQIEKAAICYAFAQNIQVLIKLPYEDNIYRELAEEIKSNIKKYRGIVWRDKKVPYLKRIGALASYGSLSLIKKLAIIYKKVINKEPV